MLRNLRVKENDYQELSYVLNDEIKLVLLLKATEKSSLIIKNDIQILVNVNPKFERLFQDIKEAKNNIHVEYYIIKDVKLEQRF